MSARAWHWRRWSRPVYPYRFDWWDTRIMLEGPPAPLRRVELARRRRTATARKRLDRRARRRDPAAHRRESNAPASFARMSSAGTVDLDAVQSFARALHWFITPDEADALGGTREARQRGVITARPVDVYAP